MGNLFPVEAASPRRAATEEPFTLTLLTRVWRMDNSIQHCSRKNLRGLERQPLWVRGLQCT